jgi:hypothetical protein
VGAGGRPLAWAGAGRLVGWSVKSGDGASVVRLRDSRQPGEGDVIGVLRLDIGEAQTVWLGPGGVSVTEGLYVDVVGDVEGSVYLGAVD